MISFFKRIRVFSTAGALALASALALAAATGCTPADDSTTPAESGDTESSAAPASQMSPAEGAATETAAAPESSEAAPAAATPAAATAGPSIVGMAKFEGERPQRAVLQTRADPKCAEMHKDTPLLSKTEVVGENGELAYVFVYVSNPPEGDYAPPSEPVVLDQVGCEYEPHVFGAVAGQELLIKNSDQTLHNVRSFARRNRPFNLGQPADSEPRSKTYNKEEEAIKFKCDVHPWMTAYMFVLEHPFFGVTGEDGTFEISGLPAGDYELTAWHETYGEQTGSVTVSEDGGAEVSFTFTR